MGELFAPPINYLIRLLASSHQALWYLVASSKHWIRFSYHSILSSCRSLIQVAIPIPITMPIRIKMMISLRLSVRCIFFSLVGWLPTPVIYSYFVFSASFTTKMISQSNPIIIRIWFACIVVSPLWGSFRSPVNFDSSPLLIPPFTLVDGTHNHCVCYLLLAFFWSVKHFAFLLVVMLLLFFLSPPPRLSLVYYTFKKCARVFLKNVPKIG